MAKASKTFPEPWVLAKDVKSAEGGQGFIFCVQRHGDGPRYAFKRNKGSKNSAGRFEREIETMRRLNAAGLKAVPRIEESGVHKDEQYYVIPWVEGGSLDGAVEDGRYRNDPAAGLDLLIEIGKALAEVHGLDVAHRDLKPGNILLGRERPLLVDFGLALDLEDRDATRLTRSAVQIGSRFYMAPENSSGLVYTGDQRPGDFYSYAKIAWAVLAGHSPPDREALVEDKQHRIECRTDEPRLAALNPLFAEMLKVDPQERLSDWRTVLTELRDIRRRFLSRSTEDLQDLLTSLDAGDVDGERRRLFDQAVGRLAEARPTTRPLLAALALARGRGIPVRHDVWAAAAAGVVRAEGLTDMSAEELTEAADQLIEAAGPYVTVDVEHGQTVCLLAHPLLVDHLLAASTLAEVMRWRRGMVQALFEAVRAMAADPYLVHHLSPYLVRNIAGHVADADAWDALADAPEVLDHLDPATIAEQVLGAHSDRRTWPPAVMATATVQHHLTRADPTDRPLIRAVEMARQPGSDRSALAAAQAHSAGAWRLAWARTQGHPPHLKIPRGGSGTAVVAAVSMGKRWLLATGDGGGAVQLWNPITGRPVGAALSGHKKGVTALATLAKPGGPTLLASGGTDSSLWLWDLATGQAFGGGPLAENIGVARTLAAVPMPDGRVLLAQLSHRLNKVNVWDPLQRRRQAQIHSESVSRVGVVPVAGGSLLATASARDHVIQLWDPVTGELVGSPLVGHTKKIHDIAVLTMPDGPVRLVSYAWDGTIRLWDLDTRECVASYPVGGANDNRVRTIAAFLTHDGQMLLATAHDGKDDKSVLLRDPLTGEPRSDPFAGHEEAVVSMACLPAIGGRALLATADNGGDVYVWDPLLPRGYQDSTDHELSVSCMSVLPGVDDAALLATTGAADAVSLWDPSTGDTVGAPLKVHPRRSRALTAVPGPGGRVLLASARGSSVRLWDPIHDRVVRGELTGHTGTVNVLAAVSMPNGDVLLASGSDDSTILLWDPTTGQAVRRPFTRHLRRIRALAPLSLPGGHVVLASGGDDHVIRLWDVATGQPVQDLPGHGRPVTALAVAPTLDQVTLASGSDDGAVHLWRLRGDSATELPRVKHGTPVVGIAALSAASGGCLFAVVGGDGALRLVDPSSGHTGPAVSLGIPVETVVSIGARLIVGSRHGVFALDLQPHQFPAQLRLSQSSGPAARDLHIDVDPLSDYRSDTSAAWSTPVGGTRWPVLPATVVPLREQHLEEKLGIQGLEPDRGDDLRRWLRAALTSAGGEGQNSLAAVNRLLRHLGEASIALAVHTLVALEPTQLGLRERIGRAQTLVHPMCTEVSRELKLSDHARRTGDPSGDGSATEVPAAELALRTVGVLSLNRLDDVLSDLYTNAYRAADRGTSSHRVSYVGQFVASLATAAPSTEQHQLLRRSPLPRSVILSTDRVARMFGLASSNDHFQRALIDPSWSPEGHTPVPETHANAALATLGAFVVNDLYTTAVVEALLSRPAVPAATLSHGVAAAALAALAERLGVRDGLLYTAADPTGGPDTSMMANAAQAILAAAYLSHKGNKRQFSSHLPDIVRSWLQLGVLSIHPTSLAEPVLRGPRRPATVTAPAQRSAASAADRRGRPPQRIHRSDRNGRGGLVLTRTPGEKIMLGDDVAIEVLQVVQNKVRLRVQAPDSLPVKREEIWGDPAGMDGA